MTMGRRRVLGAAALGLLAGGARGLQDQPRSCVIKECAAVRYSALVVQFSCQGRDMLIATTARGWRYANNASVLLGSALDAQCIAAKQGRAEGQAVSDQCQEQLDAASQGCVGLEDCSVNFGPASQACGLGNMTSPGDALLAAVKCTPPVDWFSLCVLVALVLVGLAMGASLQVQEIKDLWKHKKKALIVGYL